MKADGTVKSHQLIASGIGGGPVLADNDSFGGSITSLGDLDGDGVSDMAVGAPGDNGSRGAVYVLFMNGNGTAKSSQKIGGGLTLAPYDYFGIDLASLGDINGDGVTELAIAGGGAVYVHFLNVNGTATAFRKSAVVLAAVRTGIHRNFRGIAWRHRRGRRHRLGRWIFL